MSRPEPVEPHASTYAIAVSRCPVDRILAPTPHAFLAPGSCLRQLNRLGRSPPSRLGVWNVRPSLPQEYLPRHGYETSGLDRPDKSVDIRPPLSPTWASPW